MTPINLFTMKKYILPILFCFLLLGLPALSQAKPKAKTPAPLQFHPNGEFKILHFTDIHYIFGKEESPVALDNLNKVIEAEKPDLIIITGDMIYGKPALEGITDVMATVSKHGIPFCTTFGNHDDESGLSRSELYDIIQATPNCVNPPRGEEASPDYTVEVKSSDGTRTAAVLYCLDSHAYAQVKGVGKYAWFTHDQIGWYRAKSAAYTEANAGTPVPSFAFFHIPLPEYGQAIADPKTKVFGNRKEAGGEAKVNSGMFVNMKECGDIVGVFTGHDHDNDYALDYYGICLCYGRFSGCSNVYNHIQNGGRVIILKEGARSFDSWIRERTGAKVQPFTYPQDFVFKKGENFNH